MTHGAVTDCTTHGDIDPKLRTLCPRVCVQCDYALEGLPIGGICPECGLIEDPTVITIRGFDQPPLAALSRHSRLTLVARYLPTLLFLILLSSSGMSLNLWTWLVIIIAPLAYIRWQAFYHRIEGPPIRLRLTAVGFERRVGPGPLKLYPWEPGFQVSITPHGPTLWRLQTKYPTLAVGAPHAPAIYIEATTEQVAELHTQIARWIAAAPPVSLRDSLPWRSGHAVAKAAAKLRQAQAKRSET